MSTKKGPRRMRPTLSAGLVWIETPTDVREVSALRTRGNRLITTLADPKLKVDSVKVQPSRHIESVDIEQFESAVQVGVKLKKAVSAVEVVRMKGEGLIAISAFF